MADIAQLGIRVDSREVKKGADELDGLARSGKKAENATDKLGRQVGKTSKSFGIYRLAAKSYSVALTSAAAAAAALAYSGFSYNRMMENQTNGMQSLIVATSDTESSLGRLLTTTEMYTLAAKEASYELKRLQEINASTPHTLGQTTQIFKALFTVSKSAGASMAEMTKMTKLVSIAAGGAGIEFNQVLSSVDGLANGTFLANSEMGRFLTSLGLTNTKLKELYKTGDSVQFILDKLKTFDRQVDTMDVNVSNLTNSWDMFAGHMVKNVFKETKPAITALSKLLSTLTKDMKKAEIAAKSIYAVKGSNETAIKANDLATELKEVNKQLEDGVSLWNSMFASDNTVALLENRKKFLEKQLERLGNTFVKAELKPEENLKPSKPESTQFGFTTPDLDKFVTQYDEGINRIRNSYDELRQDMFSEERLWAQFAGEAIIVEEAFNQKFVTDIERNRLIEKLEQEHQKKMLGILTEKEKFEKKSSLDKTKSVLGDMERLTAGVATQNKAMFNMNKIAALSNAAVQLPASIMKTMEKYPYPLSVAMGGLQAAAGAVQISSIASASFGSGGTTSVPTSGGGLSTTEGTVPSDIGQTEETRKDVTIDLGDKAYLSTDAVRSLLDDIQSELDDGYTLRVS